MNRSRSLDEERKETVGLLSSLVEMNITVLGPEMALSAAQRA